MTAVNTVISERFLCPEFLQLGQMRDCCLQVPRKIRMSIYGVLTLGHSSKRLETLSLSKEQRYNSY